jgi:glycosyltransferase involved in cell wall biosynthesis
MKKVSIIIPTYKNRGGLTISLDSALRQTYPNIEIIVIDDNSPDTPERGFTEQIMADYSSDSNVIYIKHPKNMNGAAARNTGIHYSTGEFIAFLDDDDELLETKIERQVEHLEKHDDYSAVYCLSYVNGKKETIYPYEGDASIPLLMCRTKMFTSSLMFRKDALVAIGGFDEQFRRHQDYELLLKFFDHSYTIGCLQEYLTAIHSLGGNKLDAEKMLEVKKQFFQNFEGVISNLEVKKPGIKRRITAANYETVFESSLSQRRFKLAFRLFCKYFFKSPITFTQNFIQSNIIRIKRKLH